MSEKLPFKVSARTARLIGRENVATAKGAIIELVKNGYDADSKFCLVFIDNYYACYHPEISIQEYQILLKRGVFSLTLENVYEYDSKDKVYSERKDVKGDDLELLKLQLRSLTILYIVDNGDGMTDDIIRNYWMTIGTDNKASNYLTRNGRVKVGAKGIGRFALDKLGDTCEMVTFYNSEAFEGYEPQVDGKVYRGLRWNVNWKDFEGPSKTIDKINATLEGISDMSYVDCLHHIPFDRDIMSILSRYDLSHGTMLKVANPREAWEDDNVQRIYDDLGVLLPPSESNEFSIFLYSSNSPLRYGKVESSVCDDYDYKLEAIADDKQTVHIKIYRNENDLEAIPSTFFKRENQQKAPFTREDFQRGYWETTRTFSSLIPGYKDIDIDHVFKNIGKFEFLFYFLKRSTNTNDENRFFYRPCAYNLRKTWLDKYGGIKLFRDEFRVRPYGERRDSSFDWLGLGARKSKSPAGIAKSTGGYKVEPENVAGLIKISRLTNIDFEDKSSREGLQENKTFLVFQEIIKGIISIFEEDRAAIARELDADDRDRNWDARTREEAEKLVKDILARQKDQQSSNAKQDGSAHVGLGQEDSAHDAKMTLLAQSNFQMQGELDQLREEQKMLRVLASSGLMLASFSHDLSKLDITLESRYQKIEKLFEAKVPKSAFKRTVDRKNPYHLLEDARYTDHKMQNWLNFAIGVIKKDKRKRRNLPLEDYFKRLKATWSSVFASRAITFDYSNPENIEIKIFEIDLDSIFHNLFSNSIEAFNLLRVDRPRTIHVDVYTTDKYVVMDYYDSGCGLSEDIHNPDDIFKPFFTTRRNPATGEEIGTGLGMWIVKRVIVDNDASVRILSPEYGFGISFLFPIKYAKK